MPGRFRQKVVERSGIVLGLACLVIVWIGVAIHIDDERRAVLDDTFRDTASLARSFEENIALSIGATDQEILLVRKLYAARTAPMDLSSLLDLRPVHQPFPTMAIIGPDGRALTANPPSGTGVDVSDRDYFQAQRTLSDDRLFIGRPVTGRCVSGLLIPMSRRIANADGSFGGVVAASIRPDAIAKFYDTVETGSADTVALLAADLTLLAKQSDDAGTIGERIGWPELGAAVAASPSGSFVGASPTDRLRRIYAYRVVRDLPLIIVVGAGEAEAMAQHQANSRLYILAAGLSSVLILLISVLGDRHRRTLRARSAELSRQNEILEATLQTIPDGVAVIDGEARMVVWNDRMFEVLELDKAAILASPDPYDARLRALAARGDYGRGDIDRIVAERRTVTLSHTPTQYERQVASGRWIEGRSRPLAKGGAVWVYRDVTAVKERERVREAARIEAERARAAAEATSQAKSDFLANMSHELRTPLHGIIGFAQLLVEALPATDRNGGFARDILTSADILLSIINAILDLSKLEAGRVELAAIEFELRPLMAQIVKILGPKAVEKQLTLTMTIDPAADDTFIGDPDRLRQILLNLVANALKFTTAGTIHLTAERLDPGPGDHRALLRFTVRDTGIGLSPEACAVIFQKFTQADGSIARRFGGTGLGLAICRELVELMEGEVGVDSVEGQGSTFWFTVRLATLAGAAC